MRIVITGASGNIGTALLRRLANDKHEIVGIARRPPEHSAPYDRANWHSIDLTADDAPHRLRTAFAGADAVVHLAWGFQPSRDIDYLRRLGVGGTAAVLEAADTAGVAHLVHMSSVGAYSAGPGRRVGESYARDGVPSSPYSRHKAEAERLLDTYELDGGAVSIARARPGFVVQRDAGSALLRYGIPGYIPARALTLLPVLPLDRALTIPVVHADDVADALARIIEQRATGPFNLAAEPPVTADDIARILTARRVQVPAKVLSTLAGATWHARLQALDPGWIDLAFAVPLLDTARARDELGWSPITDATTALAETIEGMTDKAAAGSEVLRPRTMLGQLRALVSRGPIGNRRLP